MSTAEHDYMSRSAIEERDRRPDYKPIIEHDGLPRQLSADQETSRSKTREELLAEERDCKRRRMSYRGKKVKLLGLQVTSDILEEYMEEIKKAGGIGCFVKETEEVGAFPYELPSPDLTIVSNASRKGQSFQSSTPATDCPKNSRKQSNSNIPSSVYSDDSPRKIGKPRQYHYGHNKHSDDKRKSFSKEKSDREHYSRSPDRSCSHGRSHKCSTHRAPDYRSSSSVLRSVGDTSPRKDNHKSVKNRWQRNTNENDGSDRYDDPSESHYISEDEYSPTKTW